MGKLEMSWRTEEERLVCRWVEAQRAEEYEAILKRIDPTATLGAASAFVSVRAA
jgi:hypothetical protein